MPVLNPPVCARPNVPAERRVPPCHAAGWHAAFTLLELLVVMTIIALLAGISVPVFSAAILSSKQTACASNLRQIGIAMLAYAADHDDTLPPTTHTAATNQAWIAVLAPYLGNVDKVRICPADPRGAERLAAGGTSYLVNSFLFVPQMDPFGNVTGGPANDLSKIASPAATMMAFICSDAVGVGPGNDHTHSSNWTSWGAVTRDIAPDRFAVVRKADHSTGSSNYLFADGHVEKIAASVLRARVQKGENIALPK